MQVLNDEINLPFLLREELKAQGLSFENTQQKDLFKFTQHRVIQYSIEILKKYILQ